VCVSVCVSVCVFVFVCLCLCVCVCVCAVLRKQEQSGQLVQPVLFVLLVLVSVLLYFSVSLMDPGFILCDTGDLQVSHGPGHGPGPGSVGRSTVHLLGVELRTIRTIRLQVDLHIQGI